MRKKLKPDQDLGSVQADLIETVCFNYKNGVSVRALAKQFEISPMKTRKILITGGVYTTDLSTEIGELYKDGKTVEEIATILNTTTANVNSYLPYERIIYNMDERSVEADRQARYRERLKSHASEEVVSDESNDMIPLTKVEDHSQLAQNTLRVKIGMVFDFLKKGRLSPWPCNGYYLITNVDIR